MSKSKPARSARPTDIAGLRARLGRARAKGMPKALEERGRRILDAWLATADSQGQPFAAIRAELASGEAARKLAAMTGEQIRASQPDELRNAACASGCAFCCILLEGDGGLITEAEARQVHAALSPLAGQPDGRAWNAHACAALDPDTRMCRIYDDRPTVCRSFLSVSVEACMENAEGGDADGSGMLGNHLDYLSILALSRDVMKGTALVTTYGLEELTRVTVEGADLATALKAARHPTSELEHSCADIGNSPS
ncbi:MAG: YkgJ family cysteine cluster protein [Rhodobacteraceae bacterium]|nr:YkgJ family cysteine cluster protein [Paracoccaceae bacterium]MBR9823868.1 YkgJ family cysteine cluster protein [Paracoccaceae bacterium]